MDEFKVSDTKLEAEWQQDKIFKQLWSCSNCENTYCIEKTTQLTPYCGKCGFKMKNPQTIKVDYNYGY